MSVGRRRGLPWVGVGCGGVMAAWAAQQRKLEAALQKGRGQGEADPQGRLRDAADGAAVLALVRGHRRRRGAHPSALPQPSTHAQCAPPRGRAVAHGRCSVPASPLDGTSRQLRLPPPAHWLAGGIAGMALPARRPAWLPRGRSCVQGLTGTLGSLTCALCRATTTSTWSRCMARS
jgi:hypothetical protein